MVSICAYLATHSNRLAKLALAAAICLVCHLDAIAATPPEFGGRFDEWLAVQTNLQSWAGSFAQTRILKVLNQPLVSTGRVWVAMDRFRWELGQPPQTIALRASNQLMIVYPRLKRAEKYALDGIPPGPIRDAMGLLDATLPRDRASMEDKFRLLSAAETNGLMRIELEPKSAAAKKFMGQITIGFRTNDFSMALTQLEFSDGSMLRNDFTNVVLNAPLPLGIFELKLPQDYTVVEPLRQ